MKKGMDTRDFLKGLTPSGGTGLHFAHTRMDQAEIDACNFERINVDGCAVGVWFAPRAAYYNQFRKFVFADNP